jgi:uncharacterized membrane protein
MSDSGRTSLNDSTRIIGFSDAVFAVIITITVLSIHAPKEATFQSLILLPPVFLAYLLSFINLGIYWNNHHHLLYTIKKVKGPIMWANLGLLFFLCLIPFSTLWIGGSPYDVAPVVTYGVILLCAAIAYLILQYTILRYETKNSLLRKALGNDTKGKATVAILLAGIVVAFFIPWLAYLFYVAIVLMWVIPDKRLEEVL